MTSLEGSKAQYTGFLHEICRVWVQGFGGGVGLGYKAVECLGFGSDSEGLGFRVLE